MSIAASFPAFGSRLRHVCRGRSGRFHRLANRCRYAAAMADKAGEHGADAAHDEKRTTKPIKLTTAQRAMAIVVAS